MTQSTNSKLRLLTFLSTLFVFTSIKSFAQTSHDQITDEIVLQNMLDVLQENSRAQREACEWLGSLKDISVAPALIDALYFVQLPDEWTWSVKNLTGKHYGRDWNRWMEYHGKMPRGRKPMRS